MLKPLLITPFLMLATIILAPLLIRFGLVSPLAGFGATIGAWLVGAGAGLVAGLIGALKPDTRPLSWVALGVGVILTVALVAVVGRMPRAPIHDITTDFASPPQFTVAADHPDNASRDLTYPHGPARTPEVQREVFPAVEGPIVATGTAADAHARAIAVAEGLGWEVTWASAAAGVVEAEVTSSIFGFVDDVVIRVQGDEGAVRVDLRSTSRVGQSDLGANAARIMAFKEAWAQ